MIVLNRVSLTILTSARIIVFFNTGNLETVQSVAYVAQEMIFYGMLFHLWAQPISTVQSFTRSQPTLKKEIK